MHGTKLPHGHSGQQRARRVVRKSELTRERQWLVAQMQRIGYGRIMDLHIRDGQPRINPPPRIYRVLSLTRRNHQRSEMFLDDFILKEQVVMLFEELDRVGSGVIPCLDVRDGLPYDIVCEEPIPA